MIKSLFCSRAPARKAVTSLVAAVCHACAAAHLSVSVSAAHPAAVTSSRFCAVVVLIRICALLIRVSFSRSSRLEHHSLNFYLPRILSQNPSSYRACRVFLGSWSESVVVFDRRPTLLRSNNLRLQCHPWISQMSRLPKWFLQVFVVYR